MVWRSVRLLLCLVLYVTAAASQQGTSQQETVPTSYEEPTTNNTTARHPVQSTAMPFADIYNYHLTRPVYVVWGVGAFCLLIAAGTVIACLECPACPVYKHRERKKKNSFINADELQYPGTPVIIVAKPNFHKGPIQELTPQTLHQVNVKGSN